MHEGIRITILMGAWTLICFWWGYTRAEDNYKRDIVELENELENKEKDIATLHNIVSKIIGEYRDNTKSS